MMHGLLASTALKKKDIHEQLIQICFFHGEGTRLSLPMMVGTQLFWRFLTI